MSLVNQSVALNCVIDSSNEFLLQALPKLSVNQVLDASTQSQIVKANE